MKANELRIGNLVLHKDGVCKILTIAEAVCVDVEGVDFILLCKLEELQPIPLTEKIYNKIKKQLIDAGFSSGFNDGKITLYLSDEWELESEFLHLFQNLYFALTVEELIIKA